jgi:putative sigma-54 modulation protein
MRVAFTFRHFDSSDGIKNYATEKISKLQKYLRTPLDAEVVLSMEKHLQRVDISVQADGHRYASHDASEDMYASIDVATDKLARQIRDESAVRTHRKRNSGVPKQPKN